MCDARRGRISMPTDWRGVIPADAAGAHKPAWDEGPGASARYVALAGDTLVGVGPREGGGLGSTMIVSGAVWKGFVARATRASRLSSP